MTTSPLDLTPAEFKLIKVLWALKRGTVAEIRDRHHRMYGSDLAYTTVMTLLGRMATKRAVKVDKSRQPYVYRSAYRRESVLRERLRHFVDTVFDGKVDSLVLHLVEDESLSLEALRRIERVIEARDESVPDDVDDEAGDGAGEDVRAGDQADRARDDDEEGAR
ncbi:BlaI/MecI/CopY family transcriptional regulator [Haliangium sp.]|uniref:BlaI/MecI/CopY family transcriptional regulator n=1 Tax=Haliangium sp. TaxID=2663208 RepID=UPI003D10B3C7